MEPIPKTGFSLSEKELRVRKVGEGKGKTMHVQLFGLLSDRSLGLLHGFKQMDSRYRSTTVLYSVGFTGDITDVFLNTPLIAQLFAAVAESIEYPAPTECPGSVGWV